MSITDRRFLLYFGVVCLLFVKPLQAQNILSPPSNSALVTSLTKPLQAQNVLSLPSNASLVTSLTIEAFQQRVQALGFSTTRGDTDGKQDNYFIFMSEGRKVGGLLENPGVLELFVSYKDGATPDDLNEWNRTHFGTTAFIGQNGNAILRSNLVLEGGVTEQSVDSFITRFRDAAAAYARFILEHKTKPDAR